MSELPELPTGTVTFLFTDIEGSTKLLQRLGEGYPAVLADHQRLLRQAWTDHDGVEVDTQGDSFFVVFTHATAALAAAAQAQQALAEHVWPAGEHVRVRMGLHSGVATLSHGQYVGLDVHRAARIAAAGHGGQVLLSQAMRDQVAKELVAGAGLRDLGRHRLKDLPRREEIYQLVLPGLPADYPPLTTLDAWPGLRADLTAVAGLSLALLAWVGLLLPLIEPAFPRWMGLGAAGLAALGLLAAGVARPVRRALVTQWRDARKPFTAVTSGLLSAVIVVTTLFITKPAIFLGPQHPGYDFSYTYHTPTHTGGTVTVGLWFPLQTLAPFFVSSGPGEGYVGLWQNCLTQLPDTTLGLAGWKPDQCTEVPTVANGGESVDGRATTFHIDPRAVWSDGVPVVADDYLFAQQLYADPNLNGGPPYSFMTLTAPDPHTVEIHWSLQYGDFLAALAGMTPIPLHAYATGKFAGVYVPATGRYNTALAQQLVGSDSYLTQVPVDDGPFTVQNFVPNDHAVLIRNPRFFSNFFHRPALDRVIFMTVNRPTPGQELTKVQLKGTLIALYRQGTLDLVEGMSSDDLSRLRGVPKAEVVTSPTPGWIEVGFNQRAQAPNAQANGGVSIFRDKNVRQAFVEAFDRCAAVRAQLGITNCTDPNLFTDELTAPPGPDYDPTVKLPDYNPADAARLMDQAGYRVVDGIRRAKDGQTPIKLSIAMSFTGIQNQLIGQRMQQDYARNLKISVTLAPTPDITIPTVTSPGVKGTFDIVLWGDGHPPDPVGALLGILGGADAKDVPSAQNPTGANLLGVIDPVVAKQDALGRETLDSDQRASVYRDLQRHVTQQFYEEPVYVLVDVTLTRPTLCNFKAWLPGVNTWNMADWFLAPKGGACP